MASAKKSTEQLFELIPTYFKFTEDNRRLYLLALEYLRFNKNLLTQEELPQNYHESILDSIELYRGIICGIFAKEGLRHAKN